MGMMLPSVCLMTYSPHRLVARHELLQVGRDELPEHPGRKERPVIKGIVRAQGKAVNAVFFPQALSPLQRPLHVALRNVMHLVRSLEEGGRHFYHVATGGDGECGVAVGNEQVFVAHDVADESDGLPESVIIGSVYNHDNAVVQSLGNFDVQFGVFAQHAVTLGAAGVLELMPVMVFLAQQLLRELELQFEGRYLAVRTRRLTFQCPDSLLFRSQNIAAHAQSALLFAS
jgi:hypothetical protein